MNENRNNSTNSKNEIDRLVNKIFKNQNSTKSNEILKEIYSNNEYIRNIQLSKLIKLNDIKFQRKTVLPMNDLYIKYYNASDYENNNLQREAEIIDRDLRIIELTIQSIKENNNINENNRNDITNANITK
ncbi:hypothetical protein TBLA_0A06280 [Henningerozyma blattae CBS 6284]|uniref:Uncharacterized protein n=1 Tax=Henningerozyma blattae (strain ATCC 34711 / CBS 6284 / DSM 70876 / NBRC 10599 / NRRL Y-10934 / UCD 77-7) TaxID=1071380 RepID=I2GWB7_HENB6|nr:hypothetical protein TBLA_0A06280 [Tetrapisispora blattae CBS 6284]CCH58419.1 hypothetical protein TBLA_0A06280 [Tetrapisispora blattae CBS 6284]